MIVIATPSGPDIPQEMRIQAMAEAWLSKQDTANLSKKELVALAAQAFYKDGQEYEKRVQGDIRILSSGFLAFLFALGFAVFALVYKSY